MMMMLTSSAQVSFVKKYPPNDARLLTAQKIARGWLVRYRFRKLGTMRVRVHVAGRL